MKFILTNAVQDRSLESVRRRFPGQIQRRPIIGSKPLPPGARRVLRLADLTHKVFYDICHHLKVGNIKFIQIGSRDPVDMNALGQRLGIPQAVEPAKALSPTPESLKESARAAVAAKDIRPNPQSFNEERMKKAKLYVAGRTPAQREKALALNVDDEIGWFIEDEYGKVFVPSSEMPLDDADKVVTATVGVVEVEITAGEDKVLGTDDDEVVLTAAPRNEEAEEVETSPDLLLEDIVGEVEEEEEVLGEDEFIVPEDFTEFLGTLKNKELFPILEMLGSPSGGKRKSVLVEEITEILAGSPDPVRARAAIAKAQSYRQEE
jgi:hypothetical protein